MRLEDYLYNKGLIKTSAEYKRLVFLGLLAVNKKPLRLTEKDIEIDPDKDIIEFCEEYKIC